MPVNKIYPIAEVMHAISEHIKTTHRRVFIAYVILDHINDSPSHALELSQLLIAQNLPLHLFQVDLIYYNKISDHQKTITKSQEKRIEQFIRLLEKQRIRVSKRVQFGSDISAGCGQLHGEKE